MKRMDWGFVAMVIVLLIAAVLLSGCGSLDPCKGLTATERDRQAVADGYEAEKEGKWGSTCELQPNGTWQEDD